MSTPNGKSSSGIGFVIGALIVGAVIGFAIGRSGGGGGTTVPTASPTTLPVASSTPSGTMGAPTPTPLPPTGYNSGGSCFGPDTKNIWIYADGSNSCRDANNPGGDADVYPGNGATINWNSDPGTTLVIVFPTPKAFQHKYCGLNACTINLADSAYHLTPQPYAAYVYGRGTPTPAPGGKPTPTPRDQMLGHIIIKP